MYDQAEATPSRAGDVSGVTADLHRSGDWFKQCGIKTVAIESTGVYWVPAFQILEQRGFAVVLVNAGDAKHVPGRKRMSQMRNGCSDCTSTRRL
jgi:transposase